MGVASVRAVPWIETPLVMAVMTWPAIVVAAGVVGEGRW